MMDFLAKVIQLLVNTMLHFCINSNRNWAVSKALSVPP